ncbi:UDP-galactose transporter [Diplodia seriata]|uniref:UDP-galactose transporter homolog 1 n=2 Tax=Diplodia seriata TaxID=420778 RepID=A0ABR3CHS7_9PEZI
MAYAKWTVPHLKAAQPSKHRIRQARDLSFFVGGYFLASSVFQERVFTSQYPETGSFRFPVFFNTIQSLVNAVAASLYISLQAPTSPGPKLNVPTLASVAPLIFISWASNFGSQFGTASLRYVDYSALVVSKSCMLLPVVSLNILLLGKSYPFSRYVLFIAVTLGLLLVTLESPLALLAIGTGSGYHHGHLLGFVLLLINLFLEGSTYIVLEHVVSSPAIYGGLRGPQRMLAQNMVATLFTTCYLIGVQLLPESTLPAVAHESRGELFVALQFLAQQPAVIYNIACYAVLAAASQLLLFVAFPNFSSLVQTNIRVVRKTLAMLTSILWFQKKPTGWQWLGLVLVFGGAAVDGWMQRLEYEEERHEGEKKAM